MFFTVVSSTVCYSRIKRTDDVLTDNYSVVAVPRLLWSTPQNHVMFEGQNKSIKCIFAGL